MFCSGQRGWRGGEWMRGLGLGFINPVLDVCLCCGGVCGEWGWTRVWRDGVMSV